jgi:rubrerythrin
MSEYIDKDKLYNKLREREDVTQKRVVETPATINGALSPCFTRYSAQLNEVTRCRELVADSPTADVKPVVHGKWKRKVVDNGFNADWICSECGYKTMTDFVNYNYCPNCGADMRGAENETN